MTRTGSRRRTRRRDVHLPLRAVYRVFWPFLRPHYRRFALSGILVLAGTATGLLKPWPLKYLFDRILVPDVTAGGGTADVQVLLLGIVGAIAAIAVLDSVVSFARSYVLTGLGETVSTSVRSHVYEHLQRLSLRYHERQRTGDLLTRIMSDVDKVQSVITTTAIEAGAHAVSLVAMLVVMFVLDWQLSLVILVFVPLLLMVVHRFRQRIKRAEEEVRSSEGDLASIAQETLSAIKLVKAYGRERHEAERFRRRAEENLGQELRVLRVAGGFSITLDLVSALALGGLVWLGAQRVLSGDLTPGDLIVFTSYLRDVIGPARALSRLPAQITKASVRADKIAEVLRAEPDVVQRPDAVPAPPLSGRLELRSVSFGYQRSRPVLHDVDIAVRPGETVAVVGATGAGKSTLAGLLCRLYDPDSGAVHADGHDVRDLVLATYQAQLAIVLQQTMLFCASIRDNIAYGRPEATDDEVRAAARLANADEFIDALPEGYDTVVGERGDTLSGGQRQRIAIARAVLRDARVLILDEPTTGLDARSEREVMRAIEQATAGRTTVIISHQLSTVVRADRIVVLDKGLVVEQGSHDHLVALDGHYATMARLQGLVPPQRPPTGPGPSRARRRPRSPEKESGGTMRDATRSLQSPTMMPARGRIPEESVDPAVLMPRLERAFDLGTWRSSRRAPHAGSNVTYFVDTERAGCIVLRRSHAGKTVDAARFEAILLDHLRAHDYPAPRVLRTIDGDVLFEVDGIVHMAFGLLPGSGYDARPDQFGQAARYLARYHRAAATMPLVDVPATSPALAALRQVGTAHLDAALVVCRDLLDARLRQRLASAGTYLADEMVLLAAELEERPGNPSMHLLHGSYGRSALLFEGPRLTGVVDFDRTAHDLLGFDLAYAMRAFCHSPGGEFGYRLGLDPALCRAFLAAYGEVSPVSTEQAAALPLAFRAQRLIKVVKKCNNLLTKHAVLARTEKDVLKFATILDREEQRMRWLARHGEHLIEAVIP